MQASQQALGARVHIGRRVRCRAGGQVPADQDGPRTNHGRLGVGAPQPAGIAAPEGGRRHEGALEAGNGAGRVAARGQRRSGARRHAPCGRSLAPRSWTEAFALIRPGVSELDLAAEIDYRMRRKGASGPSFETIVASGPRSALPHAQPTEKRLQKNELVVLDLGAILRHYCSDLTRTVYVGRAPAE